MTENVSQALYGRQTLLGVQNFPGEDRTFGDVPDLVRNYAWVKSAAARANVAEGVIDAERGEAIEQACQEIAAGRFADQFPTALVLGGGGTTTNMNMNEVVAARASQIAGVPVHPNDHVNASQSTNDSYPTAMALTVVQLARAPIEAVRGLIDAFDAKAAEYEETARLGRTCLQDAVSLTVGQTHRSQSAALRRCADSLQDSVHELLAVPLGATVLGTGVGAPEGYRQKAVAALAEVSGMAVTTCPDMFDALSHLDPYARVASAASLTLVTMAKIAQDLRMLSSGPIGGLEEVVLPSLQAGSSIMPGKINPVVPEYVMQLSYRARGAAHTVEAAVAAGELELNVMEPVIVDSLIDMFNDLANGATAFAEKCISGLRWNGPRRESNLEGAFDAWVELAGEQGYDVASAQVKQIRTRLGVN